MNGHMIAFDESTPAWERAFYVFLAEKERRSGSQRTVVAYSRMVQRFFGTMGKPPDKVTSQEVFSFAHGRGRRGGFAVRAPSWVAELVRQIVTSLQI